MIPHPPLLLEEFLPPCRVSLNHPGLFEFLNARGSLWLGTLHQKIAKKQFEINLNEMIWNLTATEDYNKKEFIDHRMNLIRYSLTNDWLAPVVWNRELSWELGGSRLLATGIVHDDYWKRLPILCYEPHGRVPNDLLGNYQLIDNAQDFINIFDTARSKGIDVLLDIFPTNDPPGYWFSIHIYDVYNDTSNTPSAYKNYLQWYKIFKNSNKLKVFTQWPGLLKDSENFWDLTIDSRPIFVDPARPSKLSRNWQQRRYAWDDGVDHELYISNPVSIDLSHLLIWMELRCHAFIDREWNFALIRKHDRDCVERFIKIPKV